MVSAELHNVIKFNPPRCPTQTRDKWDNAYCKSAP